MLKKEGPQETGTQNKQASLPWARETVLLHLFSITNSFSQLSGFKIHH